jgi:hypothetical protein
VLALLDGVAVIHSTDVPARAPVHDIIAAGAVDGVERIDTRSASQDVVPETTEQAVESPAADDLIAIVTSAKIVCASATEDHVLTSLALHEVSSASGANDIVTRRTAQRLRVARSRDRASRLGRDGGGDESSHREGRGDETR